MIFSREYISAKAVDVAELLLLTRWPHPPFWIRRGCPC